jgi:hypothetical protein
MSTIIYLYIKTHNVSGIKYFGMTTESDPHKYPGSGKIWKRHLKKYGRDWNTEIVAEFTDVDEAEEFGLQFSSKHNIVESPEWANLIVENAKVGKPKGTVMTKEQKKNLKGVFEKGNIPHNTGKPHSEETKRRISEALTGRIAWNKGKKEVRITCPHCNKTGGKGPMKRYHFDNCPEVA